MNKVNIAPYLLLSNDLEYVNSEYCISTGQVKIYSNNNEINFREDNTRDCTKFVNYITEQLERPNVNIVVGHTGDRTAYDYCNTNINGISSIYDIKRKNADGSLKPCLNLPVSLCTTGSKSAAIYKIDTHISRMSGTNDYRQPKIGSLNSLIIDLNPDGAKKNVSVLNSYIYNTSGILSQPIPRS